MVRLGCVSCGAPLEIGPELETFACGYCGSQQRVERKGGTVILSKIESMLKSVQRSSDRTAAELALPRLAKELSALESDLQLALASAAKRQMSASSIPLKRAALGFLAALLSGPIFWLLGGESSIAKTVLTLLWIASIFVVPRFLYRRKVELPPDELPAIQAHFDLKIRAIKHQINANLETVRSID